jgi:hypothetical protein
LQQDFVGLASTCLVVDSTAQHRPDVQENVHNSTETINMLLTSRCMNFTTRNMGHYQA